MLTYTYIDKGKFELIKKKKPVILDSKDAIVKVTLSSICSSDLHIKHGSIPKAVKGITVGHEMVGVVEEVGSDVTNVKVGVRLESLLAGNDVVDTSNSDMLNTPEERLYESVDVVWLTE